MRKKTKVITEFNATKPMVKDYPLKVSGGKGYMCVKGEDGKLQWIQVMTNNPEYYIYK